MLPQNVQTIFVHHELRYIRNENEMNLFQAIRPSDRMNFLVAKDFEWNALQKYKHIIALTEVDRLLLANCLGREEHIYASPAVVKFDRIQRRSLSLVFIDVLLLWDMENIFQFRCCCMAL